MKLQMLAGACLLLSFTALAQELPTVTSIEKEKLNCRDWQGVQYCDTDDSKMKLELSYGGCRAGKLELRVDLGPVHESEDSKYVNEVTVSVVNTTPTSCEMGITETFEVKGEDVKKLALEKAQAIDPKISVSLWNGIKLANPIKLLDF